MIECLISWIIILVSAYLWGSVWLDKLAKVSTRLSDSDKMENVCWRTDDCIIAGMCMLTVYAQAFSIFYKVGAIALAVVMVIDVSFLFMLKKQLLFELKQCFSEANGIKTMSVIIVCVIVGISVLRETALPVGHYDSTLYHAQSIRWIEEYGVVKGLGNLHNRLAYNSAFFCLQALFSFSFLIGKSLHTVNGLIVAVFLCYAVCSAKIWNRKGAAVSDFIRLGLVAYLVSEISVWSSPGSDLLSVGLVLYIICKWQSYSEDKENELLLYTELCFLAVWAVSVKLSATVLIILVVYPAFHLLRNKEWKRIVVYILTGIGIISPFLVRNVLISGYAIYPYPELDLFHVDWKMPAYTLLFDRNEITAWGRGLKDVFRFNEPIKVWFPIWYESLGTLKKWWWMAVISGIIMLIKSFYMLIQSIQKYVAGYSNVEDALKYMVMVLAMTGCMLLWFVGAPLPRYGGVFIHGNTIFHRGNSGSI